MPSAKFNLANSLCDIFALVFFISQFLISSHTTFSNISIIVMEIAYYISQNYALKFVKLILVLGITLKSGGIISACKQ